MELLTINLSKRQFTNENATENLIRYITRTRLNEDRRHELLSCGYNYASNKTVEEVIREFEFVQNWHKSKDCMMIHYVLRFPPDVKKAFKNNLIALDCFAQECCRYLFSIGHQTCYAIHLQDVDDLHVHLAINAVNYKTGNKLRQYYREISKTVEKPLKEICNCYIASMNPVTRVATIDDLG
jgi:hypothetical protein